MKLLKEQWMRADLTRFLEFGFAIGTVACSATAVPDGKDPLDQPVFSANVAASDGADGGADSGPALTADAGQIPSLLDAGRTADAAPAADGGSTCVCIGTNLQTAHRDDCCAPPPPPTCAAAGGNTCAAGDSTTCNGHSLITSSDCGTCCYVATSNDAGADAHADAAPPSNPPPTCDVAGGNTCGPNGSTVCNGKTPINSSDCAVCCYIPPPPPPPSCSAAGGNTCGPNGSTVCNGKTPINSSDCAVCCYIPPPPPPPSCGAAGGNTCGAAGSTVCNGETLLNSSDCAVCCFRPPPPPPPSCGAAGGNTCGAAGSTVCNGETLLNSSDCAVCCFKPPPPPPPSCGAAGGNTCGAAGSTVCNGETLLNSSDCAVCCYKPPPPPPPVCGVAGGNTCGAAGSPVCNGYALLTSSDCPVCCYVPPPPPPPVCGVAGGNTCGAAGSDVCDGYALLSSIDCPVCCYKPPPPTCDIFVHVHSHSNQWFAVWAPAVTLKNGQEDPGAALLNLAGASGDMTGLKATTVIGAFTFQTRTNGQPGSAQCPAYYSENYSPLLIDLKGSGIALTAPNAGVRFDIVGDGTKMPISWPSDPEDAVFLALPQAGGVISSIDQLFGNNTVGPDGRTAKNGFDALAKYDTNRDLSIDARDPVFSALRLWSDLNKNGTVEEGELLSLKDRGIESIDLRYINKEERSDFYGNESRERSRVTTESGKVLRIFDIWFVPGVSND